VYFEYSTQTTLKPAKGDFLSIFQLNPFLLITRAPCVWPTYIKWIASFFFQSNFHKKICLFWPTYRSSKIHLPQVLPAPTCCWKLCRACCSFCFRDFSGSLCCGLCFFQPASHHVSTTLKNHRRSRHRINKVEHKFVNIDAEACIVLTSQLTTVSC